MSIQFKPAKVQTRALKGLRQFGLVLTLAAFAQVLTATPVLAADRAAYGTDDGTIVTLRAAATVLLDNDVATVTFNIQEQRPDKNEAISKVNERMKRALALLRQADPEAILKTQYYSTYAIYPPTTERTKTTALPQIQGWRVSQSISMTTSNLATLTKSVGMVQGIADLNGINFSLSEKAQRQADDKRIAESWQALNARIASVARAMGKPVTAAKVLEVNLDGAEPARIFAPKSAAVSMRMMSADVDNNDSNRPEPSFEPGQTQMSMDIAATVKFAQ